MISSRTKHESFNSFGSHAHLLAGLPISLFYLWNEHILSSLFGFPIWKGIVDPRPEYSEDSSDQTKICNYRQSCFFFFNPKIPLTLYIGRQFRIG
ncbi:hypothetical protein AQUCO_03800146v1 [Aquilegia coerulea]|uniref:Uncharacterized protein n=1 Tax=Aquilegia coerulea TaxID=218851 RepID=A0A2G5CTY2_AQUCA|nr:hypothetical protein AQUCO_03800146v1 [Aquilegia coerulea]